MFLLKENIFSCTAVSLFSKCRFSLNFSVKMRNSKITRTPIVNDTHVYIEEFRTKAEKDNAKGPVTLIVGPTDVGKSTLTHSLLDLAASHGRTPILIDLDVGQSSVSIPGTIGILPIRKRISEGFDDRDLAVYFFGYKSPGHNMQLYLLLIKKISEILKIRLDLSPENICSSGVIVDTCGWVIGAGYSAILQAADFFDINILLVVGDRDLYDTLLHDVSSAINIMFIPKLNGVVRRDQEVRRRSRENKVKTYFYGSNRKLQPYMFDMKFSDLQIFTVTTLDGKLNVEKVHIGHELLHQVLGVSHASEIDNIMLTSIFGFISLMDIDLDSETVKILSPQPSPLPNNILLLGDITLMTQNN